MPNIYVRSSDGSDADSGLTIALAKATASGAAAIDAAGDTIFFASTHDETAATALSLAFAGTAAAPVRLISADFAAEPPTAVLPGAAIRNSGASTTTLSGAIYAHGLTIQGGGGSGAAINMQGTQTYEACNILLEGASTTLAVGNQSQGKSRVRFTNTNIKLTQSTARLDLNQGVLFEWNGGSLLAGSTCTSLLHFNSGSNARGGRMEINGVDLSAGPTSMNIMQSNTTGNATIRLRGCKLPAGWTGLPIQSGSTEPALRVELWNCSAGADNISYWMQEPLAGEVRHNAAVYVNDFGAGTPHSLRFASVTTTNATNPLVGPDLMTLVAAGAYTASVEVITDGVTLTDGDAWLEVMAMSSSGSPLGVWVTDKVTNPLATPANQEFSSQSWTLTGLASPLTQKLSVSVSPVFAGYLIARVVLNRPSTVMFVDPALRVA